MIKQEIEKSYYVNDRYRDLGKMDEDEWLLNREKIKDFDKNGN